MGLRGPQRMTEKMCKTCKQVRTVGEFTVRTSTHKGWVHRRLGDRCQTCKDARRRRPCRVQGCSTRVRSGRFCADHRYGVAHPQWMAFRDRVLTLAKLFPNIPKKAIAKAVLIDLHGGACARCMGTFPPIAMDFDHVRGAKAHELSSLSGLPAMFMEALKCELLCSNCHRIRTAERRGAHAFSLTHKPIAEVA